MTAAWVLTGQHGPSSLKLLENQRLPSLREHQVLVRLHAASLNHRDLAIAKGQFNLTIKDNLIPCSDGAGIIEAIGPALSSDLQPGDRVITHMVQSTTGICRSDGAEDDTPPTFADIGSGLGQHLDGTLRQHGIFHENCLVRMPANLLDFGEAATLSCSGLTAWNALFGVAGLRPRKGDVVLVQGSGGVSVAALQFALASSATVIATTSSPAKASKLTSLGAHHVLNYKEQPHWGAVAKSLTPSERGVDLIVDVGGPSTLGESLKAVRPGGVVAMTGLLGAGAGGASDVPVPVPDMMQGLVRLCVARGVLLGTRAQFREMNAFVEKMGVRPVVDGRVFGMGEVREAYEYMMGQGHFSKVVIDLDR